METTSDGSASVSITLADGVTVNTWNNAFSDDIVTQAGVQTLIPQGTKLYSALSELAVGAKVTFSGEFIRSNDFATFQDSIEETSLTEEGSMTDPEFLMHFRSIKPDDEPTTAN
jgi:hypothetical protein